MDHESEINIYTLVLFVKNSFLGISIETESSPFRSTNGVSL